MFQNKTTQSGRSLIEIIAILVIMAILLIAALLGFKALLNYLKYKETAKEVTVLATRYKLKKLQARKSPNGKVRIRDFYPEGKDCNPPNHTCVATNDGGQLELISSSGNTSFAVVATNLQCVSCREIIGLGTGAYGKEGVFGMVVPRKIGELDSVTLTDAYTPQKAKENIDTICGDCTEEYVEALSFIYGDECKGDARYFVNGKCSYCKNVNWVKADGKAAIDGCCDPKNLKCGYCGEPKNPDECLYCIDNSCVECRNGHDEDCNGKIKDGIKTPYCVKGSCRPCKNINERCTDSSGSGIDMWCDHNLECKKICKDHCYEPDSSKPGVCKLKFSLGESEGALCNSDATCPQCKDPMLCKVKDGSYQCQCPAHKSLPENAPCNEKVCSGACGKAADGTQLSCRNGKCSKTADCSMLPAPYDDDAHRIFGGKCIPNDCPCVSDTLKCSADSKTCICNTLPITKGATCWGKCGCGATLTCSTKDTDAEGTCACVDREIGSSCTGNDAEDCPCTERTSSTGKLLLTCGESKRCECNPEILNQSLPAGSACMEGCDQCGPEGSPLPCINGKCGCQTDADCEGEKYCDKTKNECTCPSPDVLIDDPETGTCKCKATGSNTVDPDKFWTKFDTNPKTYVCCPKDEAPVLVAGKYQCIRICQPDEHPSVAMMLDYSLSSRLTKIGDVNFNSRRTTLANAIIKGIRSINPETRIGVFREINSHTVGTNGQICTGNKNATTIQDFVAAAPDLNQDLCGYSCSPSTGITCFSKSGVANSPVNMIKKECSKNMDNTIVFVLSDGIIPSNTATATGCKKDNMYVYAAGENSFGLGGMPHEMPFTATPSEATLLGMFSGKMCTPEPPKDHRQPEE